MISTNCVELGISQLNRDPAEPKVIYIQPSGGQGNKYAYIACSTDWGPWEWGEGGRLEVTVNPVHTVHLHTHFDANGVPAFYAFKNYDQRKLALLMAKADGWGLGKTLDVFRRTPYQRVLDIVEAGDREAFCKLPGLTGKLGPKVAEVVFGNRPEGKAKSSKLAPNLDAVKGMVAMAVPQKEAEEWIAKAMEALPEAEVPELVMWAFRNRGTSRAK